MKTIMMILLALPSIALAQDAFHYPSAYPQPQQPYVVPVPNNLEREMHLKLQQEALFNRELNNKLLLQQIYQRPQFPLPPQPQYVPVPVYPVQRRFGY